MRLLALETSGLVASAAVWAQGRVISEELLDGQLTHSAIALPMIERVLLSAGFDVAEMDAFAVNIGPGSFTGLRIGICTVNALAFACQKPVVAVDALTALAANAELSENPVCAIIGARKEQVYAGVFSCKSNVPRQMEEAFAGSVNELLDSIGKITQSGNEQRDISQKWLFTGDGADAHRDDIARRLGESALFLPPHLARHRAGSLAYLADQKMKRGEIQVEAQPFYLRVPQAVRLLEERAKAGVS